MDISQDGHLCLDHPRRAGWVYGFQGDFMRRGSCHAVHGAPPQVQYLLIGEGPEHHVDWESFSSSLSQIGNATILLMASPASSSYSKCLSVVLTPNHCCSSAGSLSYAYYVSLSVSLWQYREQFEGFITSRYVRLQVNIQLMIA